MFSCRKYLVLLVGSLCLISTYTKVWLRDNTVRMVSATHLTSTTHHYFNYSRCSIASNFTVYFYDRDHYQIDTFVKDSVQLALQSNPYVTEDPERACVFVVLIGQTDRSHLKDYLQSLPHWNGNGQNHLLLYLTHR